MICPNGHEVGDDQRFCGECGAPVAAAPVEPHDPVASDETRAGRRKWLVPILALIATIVVAVGAFLLLGGDERGTNTIAGSISVIADDEAQKALDTLRARRIPDTEWAIGEPCTGAKVSRGYGDIRPGADVTVKDGAGTIIATGRLQRGEWTRSACVLPIIVEDVPKAAFYEISVGRRGEQRYSHAELEEMGFLLILTIGG